MTRRSVALVPLTEIKPAKANVKEHDLPLTSASIDRFGVIEIPVRDERTGRLISGHGRVKALKKAFRAKEPPPDGIVVQRGTKRWLVPVLVGWASADDNEAMAAAIALNRVGEKGGWDSTALAAQLDELSAGSAGLDGLGWNRSDIDDLLASVQEASATLSFDATRVNGVAPTSGAFAEPTTGERAEIYRDKAIRSLVLDYTLDEFEVVARQAADARKRLELDSNAQVFARLLGDFLT